MEDVLTLLTEWRRAEQALDALTVDSSEWQLAVEDVYRTHAAYEVGIAESAARVHEAEVAAQPIWYAPRAGAPFVATD